MSADGKITSAAREPPRFTSKADRRRMDTLRAAADAVLMGAQTLREDDPHFIVRSQSVMAEAEAEGRSKAGAAQQPWSIVLSASCDLPLQRRFFTDPVPKRLVVTCLSAAPEAVARLEPHCEVWQMGQHCVDIGALVKRLWAAGIKHLLVEGGGQLAHAFLAAGYVDELRLTIAPIVLGGLQAPGPVGGPGWRMQTGKRLQLLEALVVGHEIFCRYRLKDGARQTTAAKLHPAGA